MDNPQLPHLRTPPEEVEPFETMDREMAKMFQFVHPDAGIENNKNLPSVAKDDDKDNEAF